MPEARKELAELVGKLKNEQVQAANWKEGPLLVLAGPGSGKTLVLTTRIAILLASEPRASFKILALTFTNKAAAEMRKRLEDCSAPLDRLFVGTFHSFCADLLRKHGHSAGLQPDFQIYSTRQDLLEVMGEALRLAEQDGHRPGAAPALLDVHERLRGGFQEPEIGRYFATQEEVLAMRAVTAHYDRLLRENNALDFNSLLYTAHQLITRYPALQRHYRQIYPFWCIDEFQDTNLGQYKLIRDLAGDEFRNLFVVADDDQVIYEWNGASSRRVAQLIDDFSPTVIQLPTNFRCPPDVIDLANRLIAKNFRRTPGKNPLIADRVSEKHEVVRLLRFPSDELEIEGIVSDVASRGLKPGEVAILARGRALLGRAQDTFQHRGFPARLELRRDEFLSPEFQWLYACLRLAIHSSDQRALQRLCGAFYRLTGSPVSSSDVVIRAGVQEGSLLRAWQETVQSQGIGSGIADLARRYLLDTLDHRTFIRECFGWFAAQGRENDSDFQEDSRAWEGLDRNATRAGAQMSLARFLQELDMHSKAPDPLEPFVTLSTIHAAKGKEFEHVYLIGMADEVFPSFQALKKGPGSLEVEEERRNCFVAITRTRTSLTLSFADTYGGRPRRPSRFLAEMGLIPDSCDA